MINQVQNSTQSTASKAPAVLVLMRRHRLLMGILILTLLIGGGVGYFVGKSAEAKGEETEETSLLMTDNPVIAKRTIVLRGRVAEVLDNSVVIEAVDNTTDEVDSFAVLVQPQTNIQLAENTPDGKVRDAGMVGIEALQTGDRIDATVNIEEEDRQETVSITAWRDQ